MELIFHIGDHKTGSSSIQRVLMDRQWVSDTVSIAYPPRLSAAQMAKTLYKNVRRPELDAKWRELVPFIEEAARQGADMAVLSAEHFSHVDPALMDETIHTYFPDHAATARFISYLRPHAGSLLSHYAQQTKCGSSVRSLNRMVKASVDRGAFLVAPRIRAWRDRFGDRLVVRPMIRQMLANGDVVQDFLTTVSGGRDIRVTGARRANESLTVQQLAGVREVQVALREHEISPKMRVAVGQHLGNVLASRGGMGGDPLRLSKGLAAQIADAYRDDAIALDRIIGQENVFAAALENVAATATDKLQPNQLKAWTTPESVARVRLAGQELAPLLAGPEGKVWKKLRHVALGQTLVDVPKQAAARDRAARVQAHLDAVVQAIQDSLT